MFALSGCPSHVGSYARLPLARLILCVTGRSAERDTSERFCSSFFTKKIIKIVGLAYEAFLYSIHTRFDGLFLGHGLHGKGFSSFDHGVTMSDGAKAI